MTTMGEVGLVCPECGTAFRSRMIMSCGHGGQDTDFRPQYWGANPLPVFVHRCPDCDFVADAGEFEEYDGPDMDLPEDPGGSGAERYALAARHAEARGASREELGWLHMRAAWCARMAGDTAIECLNMERAAALLAEAVESDEVGDLAAATYLVGELKRRCGDFEEAGRWFWRAASTPMDDEQQQWLSGLIERQRELAQAGDASGTEMPGEED